jgi:hypothetical protein
MCIQRIPDEFEEGKDYDEDAEEIMNNNESLQMMNIINQFLLDRGEDQINVLDWAMLCPHQEERVFDYFFVYEDIPADVAVQALRALLESASVEHHC